MSTIKTNKTKNKLTRKKRKEQRKEQRKETGIKQKIPKVKKINQTKLANLVNAVEIKDKCKAVGLIPIEQYTEKI